MNETTKIRPVAIKYCEGNGLDVGCGDEKIKPDAVGIDSGLDFFYGPNKDNRDLSCVNIKLKIEDLSLFKDSCMDYVYTSHFLEHLVIPQKMIDEMVRVLKPNGYLLIYLPDRILYTEPNPEHHNMWTAKEFINLLPENIDIVEMIEKHCDYSFFIAGRKKYELEKMV